MLDPAFVRDHIEEVRAALRSRGLQADDELEQVATLETRRRRLIPETEPTDIEVRLYRPTGVVP